MVREELAMSGSSRRWLARAALTLLWPALVLFVSGGCGQQETPAPASGVSVAPAEASLPPLEVPPPPSSARAGQSALAAVVPPALTVPDQPALAAEPAPAHTNRVLKPQRLDLLLLGRDPGALPRGCSRAMDELLQLVRD